MKRASTIAVATVAAALFLGASACSAGSSADSSEQGPADNALSKIDPCSILKPEKASTVGLPAQGDPETDISSMPGCYYDGDYSGVEIYRVADDTLDEYGHRSVWREFKPLKVNGRDGGAARMPDETEKDCTVAFSAGGGVVAVQISADDPRKPFDGCGEALKVAELIEPDLPK